MSLYKQYTSLQNAVFLILCNVSLFEGVLQIVPYNHDHFIIIIQGGKVNDKKYNINRGGFFGKAIH